MKPSSIVQHTEGRNIYQECERMITQSLTKRPAEPKDLDGLIQRSGNILPHRCCQSLASNEAWCPERQPSLEFRLEADFAT
jgi:hypothetical protein